MDGPIGIAGVVALLLAAGFIVGLARRERFAPGWLLAAGALVLLNDVLVTRVYGLIPNLLPASHWNWQGKVMALAATLAIAALPAFGWRRSGLTLRQARGSAARVLPVALAYCAVIWVLAHLFPGGPADRETIAFQLTMPGLEEEPFYRGILLLALDRSFPARWRFLGVDWGWSAPFTCALFGLAHAFGYADGAFSFDPLTMALTALPSFILLWLRLRTGSLLVPVLLHNFGNSVTLIA